MLANMKYKSKKNLAVQETSHKASSAHEAVKEAGCRARGEIEQFRRWAAGLAALQG